MEYRTREKNDKFLNSICRKNRRITDYRIPSFPSSSRPCSILFAFFTLKSLKSLSEQGPTAITPALLFYAAYISGGKGMEGKEGRNKRDASTGKHLLFKYRNKQLHGECQKVAYNLDVRNLTKRISFPSPIIYIFLLKFSLNTRSMHYIKKIFSYK